MAFILHYDAIEDNREYVVLTEEENTEEIHDGFCVPGFKFTHAYEIEGDLGVLPTERALYPD